MTRMRLPYIHAYIDRHGHARHYFRRKGSPKVALKGTPGSTEFREAYEAALGGVEKPQKHALSRPARPGSLDALVSSFLASTGFLGLKATSRRAYRGILGRMCAEHGDKPVVLMRPAGVRLMIAKRASTPSGANNFRAVLRVLMGYAVEIGLREDNPVIGIKRLKIRSGGFHPWTDDEIAQFEAHWPLGSRARTAFALHLYTGQRLSDVIRMTWRSIAGKVKLTQVKTGTSLEIPIHPDLAAALDAAPREHISILVTRFGAPFSPDGYGGWFAKMVKQAGLPKECASHGLRKAAARRLAEAGCTAHEIASITGHASLAEVERYTRDADQARLSGSGMNKLIRREK